MTVREEIGALSVALVLGGGLFAVQQANRSPSTVHGPVLAQRAAAPAPAASSFDDAAPSGAPTPAPRRARPAAARRHHRAGFGRPTPFTRPKARPVVSAAPAPVIRAAPVRPVVVAPRVARPAPVVRRPAPVVRSPAPRPRPKPRPRQRPTDSGEPFVLSG